MALNPGPAVLGFQRAVLALAVMASLSTAEVASADGSSLTRRLLDLTPERVAAFRDAWREFTTAEAMVDSVDDLLLVSEYSGPRLLEETFFEPSALPTSGRDLVAEEALLVAGREEDYERAMRRWLARRLKGSGRSGDHDGLSARLSWDHGPRLGVGMGPVTVTAGSRHWKVKLSRQERRSGGPWRTAGYVQRDDDDVRVGFTIGRSILASRTR